MKTITLQVSGMTCGHCEKAVTNALMAIEGVENVEVDLKTGNVKINAQENVSEQVLKEAVEEQGYDVK
ncbi:cation transporter [Calidifontibacillus erzurumensis]|uniref:Heavy-metal-associated domain-containing protein n=1 Tax=Calidifontibacillus erzurumensis TaxID=2741433 RepID=A0A8J8KBF5_9BACI|nr:cation transporter [Calidifontibacillus erzurumensis]NSL51008.1 heavy-metal-associated domain-containing protein [Calidifontibacillus erzurumensis]